MHLLYIVDYVLPSGIGTKEMFACVIPTMHGSFHRLRFRVGMLKTAYLVMCRATGHTAYVQPRPRPIPTVLRRIVKEHKVTTSISEGDARW